MKQKHQWNNLFDDAPEYIFDENHNKIQLDPPMDSEESNLYEEWLETESKLLYNSTDK